MFKIIHKKKKSWYIVAFHSIHEVFLTVGLQYEREPGIASCNAVVVRSKHTRTSFQLTSPCQQNTLHCFGHLVMKKGLQITWYVARMNKK